MTEFYFLPIPMIKDIFSFFFELLKIIVISLVIIIPVRYFLIQPFYVKGASMEPNFYDHEYLIIDEITYRFRDPERGEIIVFRYPRNPQEYFIKRIIGLPGEKIAFRDGAIYIYNSAHPDGYHLPEDSYLAEGVMTYSLTEEPITIGENEFFVLGDNRNSSKDSRSFGAVNRSFLTGRVLLRGWPLSRVEYFEAFSY